MCAGLDASVRMCMYHSAIRKHRVVTCRMQQSETDALKVIKWQRKMADENCALITYEYDNDNIPTHRVVPEKRCQFVEQKVTGGEFVVVLPLREISS